MRIYENPALTSETLASEDVLLITDISDLTTNNKPKDKSATLSNLASWVLDKYSPIIDNNSRSVLQALNRIWMNNVTSSSIDLSRVYFMLGASRTMYLRYRDNNPSSYEYQQWITDGSGFSYQKNTADSWVTQWKIYAPYTSGTTINLAGGGIYSGLLTSSNKSIRIGVPLPRLQGSAVTSAIYTPSSVTVRKAAGGYILNADNCSGYTISTDIYKDVAMLRINIDSATAFDEVNNQPLVAQVAGTVAFS